ncbi:hypothetical protein B7494_g4666 [Chlorociboria aeruginascens]|nr:hypothetical protein B7494_g4666 [Chlorociboria aeruginascens]
MASPSFDIDTSPESRRSFACFMQRTCPQLGGFFGSDFWERLVLQAAHHEPAIRHAAVAIGSLHQLFDHQTTILPRFDPRKSFALEQYNLAIRDLLEPLSRVCLESIISSTTDTICLSKNMQGHNASAGTHIRSGAKLLCETLHDKQNGVFQHRVLGSKSIRDFYAPPNVLTLMFARLDPRVARMIGDDEVYQTSLLSTPSTFSSIEEAKIIYEYGCQSFSNRRHVSQQAVSYEGVSGVLNANLGPCEDLFGSFSLGLQAFVESKDSSLTRKEEIALAVLQLHLLNSYVSVHTEYQPPGNRSRWDTFMPQFKEMISLGEKIISSTFLEGHTTSFCLDMGIVIPLYGITTKCRDPIIRRKAIALLRSTSRQEGLWNSLLAARVAERIMELEESELREPNVCTDFSDWSNLPSIEPFLEIDLNGARLRYIRQGEGHNPPTNVVEEMAIWEEA